MVTATSSRDRAQITTRLADLVDYPRPDLVDTVEACRDLVCDSVPAAAELLDATLDELRELPPGRIEELYATAFELNTLSAVDGTCYPYVGHHLLGETYRRSRFMVGLLDRYHRHGFELDGRELPDHLLVMLRFLAACPDEELAAELVGEAILPALARMTAGGEAPGLAAATSGHVYLGLLEAIRLILAEQLWPDVEACSYPASSLESATVC